MKVRNLFKDVEKKPSNKKWTDAFIEKGKVGSGLYKNYCVADTIAIENCGNCTVLTCIMAYVSQFADGGMWIEDNIVYFVTDGYGSDQDATYEDALEFIENWEKSK